MRIAGLTVEGVGCFPRPTRVVGFGEGVNVLAAPNEAGKSTLFRALRTCLFERHSSKGKAIEALATDGASLPVRISIDFIHNGCAYTIAKSFLRGMSASLKQDGRVIAKNREADEKLWELLELKTGGARSIDEAAFGMLWTGQGQSFAPPAVSEAGQDLLGSAIEAEVGAIVGGERARAILDSVRGELSRYLTATGKAAANGPLWCAQREHDRLRVQYEACAGRLRELEEQFGALERMRAELGSLTDPAASKQYEDELKAVRNDLHLAGELAAKLATQEADERHAHAVMQSAADVVRRVKEVAQAIDGRRQRLAGLAAELERLDAEETELRAHAAEAKGQLKEIEADEERLREEDLLSQKLAAAAADLRLKSDLERRGRLLADIAGRRTQALGELSALTVDADSVRALGDIESELATLEARFRSAAPQLSVTVRANAQVPVLIADRAIAGPESLAVTEPVTVRVGDIATLTIVPPQGAAADYETARAACLARRTKLLRRLNVADYAEARRALALREDLEARLRGVGMELAALGVDPSEPEKALADVSAALAKAETGIAEALKAAGMAEMPDAASLEERRRANELRREALKRRRKALDADAGNRQRRLESVLTEKSRASGERDELQRALDADLIKLPDEARAAELDKASRALASAERAHQQAAGALAALRSRTPPPEEIERLQHKEARLQQAIDNRKRRIAELDKLIANLEGQIQTAGGDGVGEQTSALGEELAEAEREAERQERRARVLALLAATIEEVLNESRDRFHAPILRRLNPYLRDLFPGAELRLGDSFSVTGLKRHGEEPERFERLSDGTREQIAVLVRLAVGALLAEQGRPVPIVLDDALVFSDDDRIARMFDALSRAGAKQQVIVLTCRMRAFAPLGGRPLRIVPAEAD